MNTMLENPTAAHRVITVLRNEAQTLTVHPHIGRPGQIEGTREQMHGRYPYIIAYRVRNDEIQILGIAHSSRKWQEVF